MAKRRLTKSAKIWQDKVETLKASLDRVTARLDRLVKGAARLRAEAESSLGTSGEARYEASRRMGDVESAAERVSIAAERVALTVTFRTESERAERKLNEAERICRADYYADVRGVAEDFIDRWRDGDFKTRDEAIEWLDQGVDGHQRVIYPIGAEDDVDVNGDPPERVTDHDYVAPSGVDEVDAVRKATYEDGDAPCAHRDDEEYDCGKGKRLHRRK